MAVAKVREFLQIVHKAEKHTWLTQWASSMTKRARRPRSYRFCRAEISLLLALTLERKKKMHLDKNSSFITYRMDYNI